MNVSIASIAAAIGEPARARMLVCLMDGRARTSTELAVIAGVSPSTTSVHLNRLKNERLVKVVAQGKHRFYSLARPHVAEAVEALSVVAGGAREGVATSRTPPRLRNARTCYDHIAGSLGVLLHDRFRALGWIDVGYEVTPAGAKAFGALGIDIDATRLLRRKFAFACLDWSERRPHLGGALGAALLNVALKKRWVTRDLDSRVLTVEQTGKRDIQSRFGLTIH